ncbi:bactofilin family protein [Treponema sp.]|uniref:bactofilin family protein n=1 Tax=Treponema sp. TaxID=166 RepID=UPI003F12A686
MAVFNDNISINTILGAGSSVKGDVSINGFARIDGDIDGNIEASGNVIVGEQARIRGNIKAKSVTVIGGIVLGDIVSPDFVKLLSSSVIIGDIQTHRLIAEEDVIVHGHCVSLSESEEFNAAVSRQENLKAISSMSIRI